MKDVNITGEAFTFLDRITSSCAPACKQDMEDFKKYVAELAAAGKDMKLSDFISSSPAEVVFLRDIVSFVEQENIEAMDGGAILKFFGGSWHISKILADIKEHANDDPLLQKKSFANRFLFDHILTIFYVKSLSDGEAEIVFSDPYGYCLFRRTLKIPENEYGSRVKVDDIILMHFGKVIAINPKDEIFRYIFMEQNKSLEFKRAVDYVSCSA
jgi:hypothetical protein